MRLDDHLKDTESRLLSSRGASRRPNLILFSLVLLLAASVARMSGQKAEEEQTPTQPARGERVGPTYDGNWWLMLNSEEQAGFISGYQDCYISEFHGGGIFNKDIPSYVDDLNKYFLADATRQTQTVSEALDKVRGGGDDTPLPAYKAAKPPPEGQAVYDGKYWADADSSVRLGFVEGYLACHAAKLKDMDAQFSKMPSEYVQGINQGYLEEESAAGAGAGKRPTRIATILHRLRDPNNPPAKPASQPARPDSR